jgi:hypothetical protein
MYLFAMQDTKILVTGKSFDVEGKFNFSRKKKVINFHGVTQHKWVELNQTNTCN